MACRRPRERGAGVSHFRSIITQAITSKRGSVSHGAIEADSAALVCPSLRNAVAVGRKAFHIAFLGAIQQSDERFWLRGVIIPIEGDASLRMEEPLEDNLKQVRVSKYSEPLLDAISAEKSGFKGMRLLIGGGFLLVRSNAPHPLKLAEGKESNRYYAFARHIIRDDYKGLGIFFGWRVQKRIQEKNCASTCLTV